MSSRLKDIGEIYFDGAIKSFPSRMDALPCSNATGAIIMYAFPLTHSALGFSGNIS